MILFKENLCGYVLAEEYADTVLYTKTFTDRILQLECKLMLYNLDESGRYVIQNLRYGFMVDTSASGVLTTDRVDSSFVDGSGGSIIKIPSMTKFMEYKQSTSELKVAIYNDGGAFPTIACNWSLYIRVLKDA